MLDLARVIATAKDAPVGLTPSEVVWRKNKARLLRYTRATPATRRTPVFLCLPLINRAYILDLRPGASFVEFLLSQGHDVYLLDWGVWGPEDRRIDITTLVTRYVPRALREASRLADAPVTLLGYCIGGALAACYLALYPRDPVKNLILFTTPLDFADAGKFGKWTARGVFPVEKLCATFDTVPGELVGLGANLLNPASSYLGTYVQLYDRMREPGFDPSGWQAMYRWVNEGTPFPSAAYFQWITEFYQDNRLVKDRLEMDGRPVRLASITVPFLNVAATTDTIAPRPTTATVMRKIGSADRDELLVNGGHVGIVVGRTARHDLWPKVALWLRRHD